MGKKKSNKKQKEKMDHFANTCKTDEGEMAEGSRAVVEQEAPMNRGGLQHLLKNEIVKNSLSTMISQLFTVVIVGIVFTICNIKFVFPNKIEALEKRDEDIVKSIDSINVRYEKMDERLQKVEENLNYLRCRLDPVKDNQKNYKVYFLTEDGYQSFSQITTEEEIGTNAGLNCSNEKIIVKERGTGKKRSAKSLIGERVLIPYEENGQEIYFLGQFNKKYHWDGHCTINVFKEDKLILITEAVYHDGKMVSYKQVLEKEDDNIWIISDRKKQGKVNQGTSSSFYKKKDKIKKFTRQNVKAGDMLTVSAFRKSLKAEQEGFYCGNTSDGKYNDDTGKAYMVKYEKGKVRLFYCGRFKDGHQEDDTGQAWDIVLAEDGKYIYRQAKYSNDSVINNTIADQENLSSEKEIKEKLKGVRVVNNDQQNSKCCYFAVNISGDCI